MTKAELDYVVSSFESKQIEYALVSFSSKSMRLLTIHKLLHPLLLALSTLASI